MGNAWDITIDADTSQDDPKKQTLKFNPGIIVRIGCKFPRGCHGEVDVQLYKGGTFKIFPLNADGWVTGDDEEVWFPYYLDVSSKPHELIFQGASPGTTYDHVVTIRISILPKWAASMLPVIRLLTALLQRMGVVR